MVDVEIVNVVASTTVGERLDLEAISGVLKRVEYNPETFSGLVYRRRRPKATLIMFSTGKIVSVGTNSEKKAKAAIKATIREMKMKICSPIRIENVVAVANFGKEIDLESFAKSAYPHGNVMYEPDQFPGLIYRPKNVVILIFHSGKVTVTGAKREKEAKEAVSILFNLLEKLRS